MKTISIIISFLLPGYYFLYKGKWLKAIIVNLILATVVSVFSFFKLIESPFGFGVFLLIYMFFCIFSLLIAIISERKNFKSISMPLAFLLIALNLLLISMETTALFYLIGGYKVVPINLRNIENIGVSSEDLFFVSFKTKTAKPYNMIVIRSTNEKNKLISVIVATNDDVVFSDNNNLLVNGKPVLDKLISSSSVKHFKSLRVPKNFIGCYPIFSENSSYKYSPFITHKSNIQAIIYYKF